MISILGQAIRETRQNWRAAVKTFWLVVPVGVLLILGTARREWPEDIDRNQLAYLGIAQGVLSLLLLLFASIAAVAWHRRLILHEEQGWVPPWPRRHTFIYAARVVVLAIFYWVILWPVGLLRELTYAVLFGEVGVDGAAAWHRYLLSFEPFGTVLVVLAYVLAEGAVLALYILLCSDVLLSLPRAAVGEEGLRFAGKRTGLKRRTLIALLAAYEFPVVFAAVLGQLVIVNDQWGFRQESAFMLTTAAATLVAFILSLSILSVSYRADMMEIESEAP